MKKLLTFLLSVLMCVCLVNINTNRIVKADDQNVEPKQEEVLKEEVPVEEEKKEEVVTPEEETPQEEEKKEEVITPEEEKEIEEVIKEINEEEKTACLASENTTWSDEDGCVCNEQDRTWSHLSFGCKTQEELALEGQQVEEVIADFISPVVNEDPYEGIDITIYVDVKNKKIIYLNSNDEQVTLQTPPQGISLDNDGNIVLQGFRFETPNECALRIGNIPEGQTAVIKLIGNNSITVNSNNDNKEIDHVSGIWCDGSLKITSDVNTDKLLVINTNIGNYNYGLEVLGDLTIDLDRDDEELSMVKTRFINQGLDGLANSVCSTYAYNINLLGDFDYVVEGDADAVALEYPSGMDLAYYNNVFYADEKITLDKKSGIGPNIVVYSIGIGTRKTKKEITGVVQTYSNALMVAKDVHIKDGSIFGYEEDGVKYPTIIYPADYAFGIDAYNIKIDQSDIINIELTSDDTNESNALFSVVPTLSNNINAICYGVDEELKECITELFKEKNIYKYYKIEIRDNEIPVRYVSFDNNGHGKQVNKVPVFEGGMYSLDYSGLVGLFEPGYSFQGWYKDNGTFKQLVDNDFNVTENMSIYAKWTERYSIDEASLGGGVVGEEFKQQIKVNGPKATSFEIDSQTPLPENLSLDEETGVVSGTPTEKGTYTVKVIANLSDGGKIDHTFVMKIDDDTTIDFINDPAKALMLLKEKGKDPLATYEYNKEGYRTLSIHNLDYETNNGTGLMLPGNTVLKVYGTNKIKVNGYYNTYESRDSEENPATNVYNNSFGIVVYNPDDNSDELANLYIVNGDNTNGRAKLTVESASNKKVIDFSCGIEVCGMLYVNGVDFEATGGEAAGYSGGCEIYYYSNESDAEEFAIKAINAKVKLRGGETSRLDSNYYSIGLYANGVSALSATDGAEIVLEGYSAAKYYESYNFYNTDSENLKELYTSNEIPTNTFSLFNEDDSLEATRWGKISVNYYNVGHIYGSNDINTPDDEVYEAVSCDNYENEIIQHFSPKLGSGANNFYVGDGTQIARKIVVRSSKYNHPIFFNSNDGLFYKDSEFKKPFHDLDDNYEWIEPEEGEGVLLLHNFVFETSALYGIVLPGDSTIMSNESNKDTANDLLAIGIITDEDTTNIISSSSASNSVGILSNIGLRIGGQGNLEVSGGEVGIYNTGYNAPSVIKVDGGNNRIIGLESGIYCQMLGIKDGNLFVFGNNCAAEHDGLNVMGALDANLGIVVIHEGGQVTFDSNTEDCLSGGEILKYNEENYDMYQMMKVFTDQTYGNYAGKKIIKSGRRKYDTLNHIEIAEKDTLHNEEVRFIVDEDGTAVWYTTETDKIVLKDQENVTWSYDKDKNELTLEDFEYDSIAETAISLPAGLTVRLKGNNVITNKREMIASNSTPMSTGITVYSEDGDNTLTFVGDGDLTVNVENSDTVALSMINYGIESNKTKTNLIFNGTGNIKVNVSGGYYSVGIGGEEVEINSGKVDTITSAETSAAGIRAVNKLIINGKDESINEEDKPVVNVSIKGCGYDSENYGVLTGDLDIDNGKLYVDIDYNASKSDAALTGVAADPKASVSQTATGEISINKGILDIKIHDIVADELIGVKFIDRFDISDDSKVNINIGNTYRKDDLSKFESNDSEVYGIMSDDIQELDTSNIYSNAKLYTSGLGSSTTSNSIADSNIKSILSATSITGGAMNTVKNIKTSNKDSGVMTVDDSVVNVIAGYGNQSYGIRTEILNVGNTNKAEVNVASLGAVDQSFGIHAIEIETNNSSIIAKSGKASEYSNGICVWSGMTMNTSNVTGVAGRSDESIGIYADNGITLDKDSSIKGIATNGGNDVEGINVNTGAFSCEDGGKIYAEVVGNAINKDAEVYAFHVIDIDQDTFEYINTQLAQTGNKPLNGEIKDIGEDKGYAAYDSNDNVSKILSIDYKEVKPIPTPKPEGKDLKYDSSKKAFVITFNAGSAKDDAIAHIDNVKLVEVAGSEGHEVQDVTTGKPTTLVEGRDYELEEGSVKVVFKKQFLNSLSAGTHKLRIHLYKDLKDYSFDVLINDKGGSPTPSPKKDESCEKVIGPTWHWNNTKGICEDVGVVGTATR